MRVNADVGPRRDSASPLPSAPAPVPRPPLADAPRRRPVRFVLALVTFVVAAALIAFGIAQRTVLRPADHVTVSAEAPKDVRYVVLPGSVLTAHPGVQRLHLAGSGTAFAAYGRTSDVIAWLSGQRYATARLAAAG